MTVLRAKKPGKGDRATIDYMFTLRRLHLPKQESEAFV